MTTTSTPSDSTSAVRAAPGRPELPRELLDRMTLEEKVAQLVGYWADAASGGDGVAPLQAEMSAVVAPLREFAAHGLGQLTRVYGTAPVDPDDRLGWLRATQRRLREETRLGIPAQVHEECLTGLTAWRATTFPTPLAWGATFDPALVERMGAAIGATMRGLGVHQGLAPVLDVVRDARWGRVEECLGEDPWLVGEIGSAYVRGLESEGIVATLKHFVGYSSSRAGRNLAPVHAGRREIEDLLLVPFEMALLDGGARSVMHSYAEIDGLPAAADPWLLTEVLRERWGFTGTVVADYFGVAFLESLHHVAGSATDAAVQALTAGVDVELPTGDAYPGLVSAVRDGSVDEAVVDRAVLRVLAQKQEVGLLDDRFDAWLADDAPAPALDPDAHRDLARQVAEESVVLLANDGTLPLAGGSRPGRPRRVAVVGPNADRERALFGCYAFANHVLDQHPGVPTGFAAPTVLEALRAQMPAASFEVAPGCAVADDDRSGFADAVAAASPADVVVAVVGDHAGLFGRGTSGEGCDTDDLELPGVQRALVEALLDAGTPVVLVLVTGRPYAVGWALDRCAAVVQAFFPGEEGGTAIARVLSGAVNPSGRLPVTLPRSAGAQPYTYRHPELAGPSGVSALDPSPARPFGFGLSYTTFVRDGLEVSGELATDGPLVATVRVTNTGERAGDDVVQLYARREVSSVTPPVAQLLASHRVHLAPGESASVTLTVPARRLAVTGRDLVTAVEPGPVDLWVGPDCATRETTATTVLVGRRHAVTRADARVVEAAVEAVAGTVIGARPSR